MKLLSFHIKIKLAAAFILICMSQLISATQDKAFIFILHYKNKQSQESGGLITYTGDKKLTRHGDEEIVDGKIKDISPIKDIFTWIDSNITYLCYNLTLKEYLEYSGIITNEKQITEQYQNNRKKFFADLRQVLTKAVAKKLKTENIPWKITFGKIFDTYTSSKALNLQAPYSGDMYLNLLQKKLDIHNIAIAIDLEKIELINDKNNRSTENLNGNFFEVERNNTLYTDTNAPSSTNNYQQHNGNRQNLENSAGNTLYTDTNAIQRPIIQSSTNNYQQHNGNRQNLENSAGNTLYTDINASQRPIIQGSTNNYQQHNGNRQNLENDLNKLKTDKQDLENDLTNLKTDKQNLANDLNKLKTNKQELENNLTNLKTDKQKLENDLNKLKTDKQDLENNLTNLKTAKQNLSPPISGKSTANIQVQEAIQARTRQEILVGIICLILFGLSHLAVNYQYIKKKLFNTQEKRY